MNWKDFDIEKPYNYETNSKWESDPQVCWFIYRYVSRPTNGPYLSHAPCAFIDGVFEGYKSHMKTSPYPMDKIKVLFWCDNKEVKDKIMKDYLMSNTMFEI